MMHDAAIDKLTINVAGLIASGKYTIGRNAGLWPSARDRIPSIDPFIGAHGHVTCDNAWLQSTYVCQPQITTPTAKNAAAASIISVPAFTWRLTMKYGRKIARNGLIAAHIPR